MREAYRQTGHKYLGRNVGRGGRQQSKVVRAIKRLASLALMDLVAEEDARRRERVGNAGAA